jgi:carbon storage regulator
MLILTRRAGERVVIGDDVLVTVMEVSGQTVRLGIAAPQGLPIYREEIWLAVKEENRAAAEAAADALPAGSPSPPDGDEPTKGSAEEVVGAKGSSEETVGDKPGI